MTPRVLHVIASNFVGGPEKQILHHAGDARDFDCAISVASFQDGPEEPEIVRHARERGVPAHVLPGGIRFASVSALATLVRESKFDILCTHGYKANVIGHFAAGRVPHVAFVRGWTAETARVRAYEAIAKRVLRRVPWVACVSAQQAAEIAPLRGKRHSPVVIRNAVLPAWEGDAQPFNRADAGLPDDAFVFGAVGRLSEEKGHRFLLQAFAQVAGDRTYLLMLGEGRERAALEAQAAQLGIAQRVRFAGFQRTARAWMRLLDCLVQPSLTEGTPNTVLEALLERVPVIATAVGGVPDVLSGEDTGLLVAPANPRELAQAMQLVLQDPALRDRLSSAIERIPADYRAETQREKLLSLYRCVLAERS